MERICILDVDGTLLNWRNHFETWALQNNLIKTPDPLSYSFEPKPSNLDMGTIINIFNETIHISRIPPERGAIFAVDKLHKDGYSLKICSSFSSRYESMKLREQNLVNTFGNVFSEFCFTPFIHSKHTEDKIKYFLSQKPNINDILIFEDNPWILQDAIKAGIPGENCFMIAQSFNEPLIDEMSALGVNIGSWSDHIETLGL